MTLESGELANGTHHRCRQEKCAFFIKGGCQSCEACGAAPYEIKDACGQCVACEGEDGEIRWGAFKKQQKQLVMMSEKS